MHFWSIDEARAGLHILVCSGPRGSALPRLSVVSPRTALQVSVGLGIYVRYAAAQRGTLKVRVGRAQFYGGHGGAGRSRTGGERDGVDCGGSVGVDSGGVVCLQAAHMRLERMAMRCTRRRCEPLWRMQGLQFPMSPRIGD